MTALSKILTGPKINDLHSLCVLIIQYVIRFQIPMADILLMRIAHGIQNSTKYAFEFALIFNFDFVKIWKWKIFHDEMAHILFRIEINCFVPHNIFMFQRLNIDEIALQKYDLLAVGFQHLHRVLLSCFAMNAFSNNSMCAFSQFVALYVVFVECVLEELAFA